VSTHQPIVPRQRRDLRRLVASPAPDHAGQRDAFWSAIATAATVAIADVDPTHPEIATMRRVVALARYGAGLPMLTAAPAPPRRLSLVRAEPTR
jgi:hypothetical protein